VGVNVLFMHGVGVRRGSRWILSDVSWTVRENEHWVIIGPNGAGKSTLVDIAAARSFPTVGEVAVLDEVLGAVDISDLRPRIGFASAAAAGLFDESATALDVVRTAAFGMSGSWRETYDEADNARARGLLARWGVEVLADRAFASLSEGERKRVLIARALMSDPELLLLDEPGASLDLAGREDLVGRLGSFARNQHSPSMVLVTHHVEEIPSGFTHALLLREGAVVAMGPVDRVITGPMLSLAFAMPLKVIRSDGRITARSAL
jgi:iron complex transport system ATP-binding protein